MINVDSTLQYVYFLTTPVSKLLSFQKKIWVGFPKEIQQTSEKGNIHNTKATKVISHSLFWLWFRRPEPDGREFRFLGLLHFLCFLLTVRCFTLERHPRINPERNIFES